MSIRSSVVLLVLLAPALGCGTLCWSTLNLIDDMKDEDDVFESNPLNFRFRYPGSPYVELAPGRKQNRDSSLELMALGPLVFFQIIAEETEEPIDEATLAAFAQQNLKKGAAEATFGKPAAWSNGRVKGLRFSSSRVVGKKTGHGEHFVVSVNGYVFQLAASSEVESPAVLAREADRLFARFSLIDAGRRSAKLAGAPLARFVSASHPWSFALEGQRFESISATKVGVTAELVGRSTERPVFFAFTSVRLEAPLPRRAALEQLAMSTLRWEKDHAETVPLSFTEEGGETRIRFALSRINEGREVKLTFGVVAREGHAALLSVWGEDEASVRRDGEQLLQRITFRQGAPAWRFEAMPQAMQAAHAAAHGLIGQHYLDTRNPREALPWLRAASQRAPDDLDRLTALLRASAEAGEHQAALRAFAAAPSTLREGQIARSWKAWLLIESGARQEGRALFARLFEEGYRNDEDFTYYAKAVEDDVDVDTAAKAYVAYRAREGTEALTLAHAELYARHERYRDAIDVLRAALDGKAFAPQIVMAVIDNELELGRSEQAITWIERLEKNGFASTDTWFLRGRALFSQGKLEEARRAFDEAKKLSPSDEGLASWSAHVRKLLGEGAKTGIVADIAPVVLPTAVRKKAAAVEKSPPPTGHGAYFAHYLRALRYEKGAPVVETSRWRVHIVDDRGVSMFKTFRFTFDALHEVVQVDRVVVADSMGREVASAEPRSFFVADEEADGSIHTGAKVLHIPVPRLEAGSVLEVEISKRSLGRSDTPPWRSVSLARGLPVRFSAFVLEGEGVEALGKHGVARMALPRGSAFFVENPPVIKEEAWSPRISTWVPIAYVGDKSADWQALARDYAKRIAPKLETNEGLKALAAEVLAGAVTRDEKVDRVFAYAQSKLSYNAIEFGLKGIIPTPPLEAARRGYGDCKDHAALMHALLREAGIPSSLALVHSAAPLVEALPSLDQFDHMILHVPDDRGGRFLDATDKSSSRAARAPFFLVGQTALLLSEAGGALKAIPADEAGIAGTHIAREVRVGESGAREVLEHVRFDGSEASAVRDHLKELNDEERRSWARWVTTRGAQHAQLESLEIEGLADVQRSLELTLRYTLEAEGAEGPAGLVSASWERYFFEHPLVENRTSPFYVRDPRRFTSETRLTVPPSMTARPHREATHVERTVAGECESQRTVEDGTAIHRFRCAWKPGRFPAERYEPHRKAMLRVLDHASRAYVLDRARGAS
jgi:tetratricopeptide (TPR) repeat protein